VDGIPNTATHCAGDEDGVVAAVSAGLSRDDANGNFSGKPRTKMLWPKIDRKYQQELQGNRDGCARDGIEMDCGRLVAFNAFEEMPDFKCRG